VFSCGVKVYAQDTDGGTKLLFRTVLSVNVMSINLYEDHYSYVKNLDTFSKFFRCGTCDYVFNRNNNFQRHLSTCSAVTKKYFKGGVFQPSSTIFDKLASHGVDIPANLRFTWLHAVFDCEVVLQRAPTNMNTANTTYTQCHKLVSIAAASNIPTRTDPACWIHGRDGDVVKQFTKHLKLLSQVCVT